MEIGPVLHEGELTQILQLQKENLRTHVAPAEAQSQGFVTVEHTAETLRRMHDLAPSIVARADGALLGYALAMPRETRALLPILEPMFRQFEGLSFRGRPLSDLRYYVMGQICVAKPFRGRGVFDALYRGHRDHYAGRFDLIVTEVALRNERSMRAHTRVGFEVMHQYEDETDVWAIIGWAWG